MISIPFRLSVSYWAYFFYGGISMPWWPVWLSSRGLSEVEIADPLAFERLIIVAASLVVAHYADRTVHGVADTTLQAIRVIPYRADADV